MTQQGGCHCGRIAFELEGEVRDVIECNCSMCRKRGGLLAFFPRAALTLKTPEADYGTYRFNKQKKEPEIVDIIRYPAECVNPPAGVDADKWIAEGMKGAKC